MSKIKIGNIKGPKGDKGEQGAVGPKGEQGIQGPVGPAGGVNSVNGKTGDVNIADALGYTPVGGQGVNLLTGTKDFSNFNNSSQFINMDGVYNGFTVAHLQMTEGGDRADIRQTGIKIEKYGETYTASFFAKGEGTLLAFFYGPSTNYVGINKTLTSAGIQDTSKDGRATFVVDNEWKRYWVQWTLGNNGDLNVEKYFLFRIEGMQNIYICAPKLEKGTVTDPVWTPAPQDVLLKGDVDGRNLILGTAEPTELKEATSNYNYASFKLPEVALGETFTVSANIDVLKGSVNSVTTLFHTENLGLGGFNTSNELNAEIKNNQISRQITVTKESSYYLLIYAGVAGSTSGNSIRISNLKLEPGINPNPHWTPAPEDVVTKTPYDIFTALDGIPEMHRNLYRGRNLGESTAMSAEHKAAIADGSFKDLFVGDYWTHNGVNWRIADMDYWLRCGNTEFTTHHLVIVPDTCLGPNKPMNTTDITDKGYTGSDMYKTVLPSIKTEYVDEAFPSLVLTHKEYLTNAVADGHPSGGGWFESTVELMNEIMVYGCPIFTPANTGTTVPTLYTINNSQLALFQLNPRMIKTRYNYWLRDVVFASLFAYVDNSGYAGNNYASVTSIGVRPVFCIGVAPTGDEASDDMEVVSPMQEGDYMEEEFE